MKNKTKYRFLLIIATVIFVLVYYQQQTVKERDSDLASTNPKLIYHKGKTDPDKELLIGEWSKTGTSILIKITGVFDAGKLEVGFYNPNYYNPNYPGKKIEIEKANWTKIGTLLSVYIELQDAEYPNSTFKLNYVPERDMLVGTYFDALRNTIYPAEFIRIK